MTDNEIMKALDCHGRKSTKLCRKCPYFCKVDCAYLLACDAIDLINRQKAEIERLQERYDRTKTALDAVLDERADHSEAIKEFAENVSQTLGMLNAKEFAGADNGYDDIYYQQNPLAWTRGSTTARNEAIAIISNTKKEMVGDV